MAAFTLVCTLKPQLYTYQRLTIWKVQWDETGIAVYFFPRGTTPSDIDAGTPQPANWGTPSAKWAPASCDPYKNFYDHTVIFDTTLWRVGVRCVIDPSDLTPARCSGIWAGNVWSSSGIPGQEESCAQRTGFSTCEEYVRSNGANFREACEFTHPNPIQ